MCGISGYIKSDAFDPALIKSMISSIQHRGPDYTGYFSDEYVELAHARLSILDLSSNANQPFTSRDGRYHMIYNGEVYNFKELALEMNYQAKTSSDTEIILELFTRKGPDFVQDLNGMFAIAIYDNLDHSLHLWRDRFGIKPLCYYWDGTNFAFASELKALYKLPVQKNLNHSALDDYLFLEYIPQPATILQNHFKLGNGQYLVYRNNEINISTYYNINEKIHEGSDISEKQALEEFEHLFAQSISLRQISDVPLGAFLSGGIDSSMVCSALSKQSKHVSSFNIGFDDKAFDESIWAERVAKTLKLKHHSYQLNQGDLLESFDSLLQHMDEPFAVASIFPTSKVSELAKKDITVALSGDGGDELFMGYGHYKWYDRLKHLDSTGGRNVRKLISGLSPTLPSKYARVAGLLDYKSLRANWPHVWSQEQYMFSNKEINRLTSRLISPNTLNDSWNDIQSAVKDPYLQISLFDFKNYLSSDLLYKVDMASMKHSLEVRLPFLDHKVVEYALNLPTSLKIKNGQQKYLLKKSLEKSLPKEAIYREKWGFGVPIESWLQKELKSTMLDCLDPVLIKNQGIFNPKEVEGYKKSFLKGQTFLNKRIWAIMMFQIWKDTYLP